MGHILVTGGTGKTGRRVVADLRGRQIPCVAASRSSSGVGEVTFDWSDPVTWEYAIRDVDAAYLVAPMGASDPASLMIQFDGLFCSVPHSCQRVARLWAKCTSSSSLLARNGPF
jgi:uncharacterized protein YbjT (DUF2867 family)